MNAGHGVFRKVGLRSDPLLMISSDHDDRRLD
jgi:hypothetical protein